MQYTLSSRAVLLALALLLGGSIATAQVEYSPSLILNCGTTGGITFNLGSTNQVTCNGTLTWLPGSSGVTIATRATVGTTASGLDAAAPTGATNNYPAIFRDSTGNPLAYFGSATNIIGGRGYINMENPTADATGSGFLFKSGVGLTTSVLMQVTSANVVLRNMNSGGGIYFDMNTGGTVFRNNSFVTVATVSNAGVYSGIRYATNTNCASSASPAVCGVSAAGSVVIAAATTDVVVNTTAVTANSQIIITPDSSLGARLSVTCNATLAVPQVTARVAGVSFTVSTAAAPLTNPACYSYSIIN